MTETQPLRYLIEIDGLRLVVNKIRGREAMSSPWRFEANISLPMGARIDPDATVRRAASVLICRHEDHEVARRIQGIVTGCELGLVSGTPEVRLIIEPALVLARYRRDIRIFRDRDAVQIVEEVLGERGIAVERRLADSYPSRPYCVQMRENDLDFCHRLMEDEGIAYHCADSGTLVLCDHEGARDALPGGAELSYALPATLLGQREALLDVDDHAELTVGTVSLRDWNPEHPSLDMDVKAAVPGSSGPEFYDFPGEYLEPGAGAEKARRFAESLRANAAGISGVTCSPRMIHGHVVALGGAPGVADGEYVVTAVEHAFEPSEEGFENRFEAIPRAIPWRPLRRTHVPELPNPMSGFVTGPAGADIHTDAVGRVKVHFPWDRRQPWDDSCSDWIPVLQDNTGQSVAMPRIGWEVLVHFLEGDPDRPVVLGRVYNGADPFPEPLPAGKTRSALRSLSSPTRDGLNMIRFDDAGGTERVDIHAEKDQTIAIARNKRIDVGATEQAQVGGNEAVTVGADATALVGQNRTEEVTGNQTLEVSGNRKLEVKSARGCQVKGNHTLSVASSHMRRIQSDDVVQAKRLREQVGAVILEASLSSNSINAGMAGMLTVGGVIVELARKSKVESANLGRIETIGGLLMSSSKKKTSASAKARITTVGGAFSVTAAKAVSFDAGVKLQIAATAAAFAHPASITLKVGGASVTLAAGVVSITAPGKIAFRVSGPNMEGAVESALV